MFRNRIEAGRILLREIVKRGVDKRASFLFAIPRGGVEVAFPVASGLRKRIIPLVVHKIPASYNRELAIGAVSQFGDVQLSELARSEDKEYIEKAVSETFSEIKKRLKRFASDFDFNDIRNRTVLVIDDGIATGETLYLAVKGLLKFEPAFVVVAVPVSSEEGFKKLSEVASVISLIVDRYFYSVFQYFEEFPQLTEEKTLYYISESKKFEIKGM